MRDSWDWSPGRIAWAVAGAAVAALVAYALYTYVGAIVLGLFLYYATRPAYRWLDDRIDHPNVSASVAILLVGLPLLLIVAYAGLVGVRELDRLLDEGNYEQFRSLLQPYVDVAELTDPATLIGRLRGRFPQVLSIVQGAMSAALRVFVAIAVGFYLLRDDEKIAAWAEASFENQDGVVSLLAGVDDDLSTIYTGNLITIVATTVIAVAVYYALDAIAPPGTGVASPVLLGLLTGVATLIPAIGMKLVYVPYTGYLVWRSVAGGAPLWFPPVFFVVVLAVIDSFPDIVVRSYVSKGDINMGLIMLGYVLGAVTFGWYGVFLAPVILVVFLHFAHRVFPNLLDPAATRLVTDDWPE